MDEKFVAQVKRNRQEMLQTATHCFSMAAKCDPDLNEDKWLHNYMLGKCWEKARRPLREYVPYYLKVRIYWYNEHFRPESLESFLMYNKEDSLIIFYLRK